MTPPLLIGRLTPATGAMLKLVPSLIASRLLTVAQAGDLNRLARKGYRGPVRLLAYNDRHEGGEWPRRGGTTLSAVLQRARDHRLCDDPRSLGG